jgi:Putative PD-(D/E)XK phosphodiesterase (DUF2161)
VGEANRSVAATASGPACSSILFASGFAFDDNAQGLARLPRKRHELSVFGIAATRRSDAGSSCHARRGDPSPGGASRQPVMTAYRQQALACAALLKDGPRRVREVRKTAPDASRILLRNVYGWFERSRRGVYCLTVAGHAALLRWPIGSDKSEPPADLPDMADRARCLADSMLDNQAVANLTAFAAELDRGAPALESPAQTVAPSTPRLRSKKAALVDASASDATEHK